MCSRRIAAAFPARCCLIEVSPELARTIAQTIEASAGYDARSWAGDLKLLRTLERDVADCRRRPVQLTIPDRSPIQPVLEALLRSPSDKRTLTDWAKHLKIADRSLTRKFRQETGMSLGEWRKRARALYALERLCASANVRTIAAELGYDSVSAFVHMFRVTLGTSPTQYYRHA
jgi:AraC-like DNA-binding protein